MEDPKVSVIIPVYNAGHRLKACIESLVSQTLKELELIFVLDCPTDGSDKIVMEYSKQYHNIIVITNEKNLNIGLSRNEGLKVAKGEYVAFCDHDDIVQEYMYEHMYEVGVSNDADIVLGVPKYSYKDSSKDEIFYYPIEGNIKERLLPLIIGKDKSKKGWEFYFSHGVIWDNIYRMKMIKDCHIQYVDNNKITFEDNLFLIESLIHCNMAIVHNELVYNHTIEDTNTASSEAYTNHSKVIAYISYLDKLLKKNALKELYADNFVTSSCSYLKGCYSKKISIRNISKSKKLLNSIKNEPVVKELLVGIDTSRYIRDSRNLLAKIYHGLIFHYLKL